MSFRDAFGRRDQSMNPRVVFVDVDDTLIRSVGAKRIPLPAVVARIRELREAGALPYLWSSGGAEYAQSAASELGIASCFVAFLPKPDAYLDDQPVSEWRYCSTSFPAMRQTPNLNRADHPPRSFARLGRGIAEDARIGQLSHRRRRLRCVAVYERVAAMSL